LATDTTILCRLARQYSPMKTLVIPVYMVFW